MLTVESGCHDVGQGGVLDSLDLREIGRRVREAGQDAAMVARLTRDLPRYLRRPISGAEAQSRIRGRLERREQRLLTLVERTIYRNSSSPYRRLLRQAGCELGDFQSLVRAEGVEGALPVLAQQGVYLTSEESKGRAPVVRGSETFTIRAEQLDNPISRPHLLLFTSGTGGRPTRVPFSLEAFAEQAASIRVSLDANGIGGARQVYWWPAPIHHLIAHAMIGREVIGWFYQVHPLALQVRLAARYLALLGATAGVTFPLPRRCDLTDPELILAWILDQRRAGQELLVHTMVSCAVRVSSAALTAGRDLRGVTFWLGGEPTTEARREHVTASGAGTFVQYSSVELSGLTYGCGSPAAADDVHVMEDRFAVVQRRRAVSEHGPTVDATMVTSLTPHSAKIALNVELGDYARLERRACDCLLGTIGLRTHLSEIRSFEKLTSEGVTFASARLQAILEEVLPARFGGTAVDYQVAEVEGPGGTIRAVLRVNPAIGPIDEAALVAVLLAALGEGSQVERYHAEIWRSVGALTVSREAPVATQAGRVLPFLLLRRATEGAARG